MRKSLLLLSSLILLFACKTEKKIDENIYGHWINEDFYNHILAKKPLQEFTGEKFEFVIQANDTNYSLINFIGKVSSGPIELSKNNNLVIKDFYGHFQNADIVLKDNKLEFINPTNSESQRFIKIDGSEFDQQEILTYSTFTIPFINKTYLAGDYLMNSDTVRFFNSGKIINLENNLNYSFCLNGSCRNSDAMNTLFLSNSSFQGNYYEYSLRNDSLIIYEIDKEAFARGYKAGNIGVKYQLKKIN